MVGIACLVDLILYAIAVGKITASSMGTILHYCRQNFKHSKFIPKMVTDLIELKMWPLRKRGVAESMDGILNERGHLGRGEPGDAVAGGCVCGIKYI